jgi:hypothetical protein
VTPVDHDSAVTQFISSICVIVLSHLFSAIHS